MTVPDFVLQEYAAVCDEFGSGSLQALEAGDWVRDWEHAPPETISPAVWKSLLEGDRWWSKIRPPAATPP